MFERFTPPARNVVVMAADEARGRGHPFIGTEHLLLALLRIEEGIAADALAAAGVRYDDVVAGLEPGAVEPTESGQIPFAPAAKAALDQAVVAADSMKHHWIGTEHLLLGLADERIDLAPAWAFVRRTLRGN